ncbi:MAG: sigma-70 family RNA polymerase sigma factor [Candidatus Binataceae bacterium]
MKFAEDLTDPIKKAWHQFIERTEPLRPDLYRYCRSLTGSVWDAEDLVQDTLMRAFARLSEASHPIDNARAYMFRIASNLWIDRFRGTREFATGDLPETAQPEVPRLREIRDAAEHLVSHLPPMERSVVLLKDVFDFSLDETATALDTTVGAVKTALHRGRGKLKTAPSEPKTAPRRAGSPSPELLDRFVDAFNARDLKGLAAMMREDATVEVVGMGVEYGRDAIGREHEKGSLYVSIVLSTDNPRAERREYLGEPIILSWVTQEGRAVVNDVLRFQEREGMVSHFNYYYFCPETLSEIAKSLSVPVMTNGYKYDLE